MDKNLIIKCVSWQLVNTPKALHVILIPVLAIKHTYGMYTIDAIQLFSAQFGGDSMEFFWIIQDSSEAIVAANAIHNKTNAGQTTGSAQNIGSIHSQATPGTFTFDT